MPLFQQSVLKKYLTDLDQTPLQKSWQLFTNLFHNSSKQENIRNAKEEQYQEGFLRELFVQVLGYTLNPEPDFNLTTEYKNEKDSKKADGAILKNGAVMGVIELKGTDTTDLAKVETQAFGYKNNQKGCTYIITSNFEKIRFYINDAIDFEEFNLFLLTKDEFALLYLCLHKDNLLKDIPLKLKQASITEEENVTKKLYSDYSTFKKLLFKNITELNPQYDKLLLFQKTQKLLDRFLFILFAEDRLLLPPNSVRRILGQWEKLKELDAEQPLYTRFKMYFGYMNTGRTGKEHDIFAYNGGLFVTDEVLDNIVIDDDILYKSTFGLSNYNFETEVDVNILGHIFEHCLSEIEEVQSQLEGKQVDKSKTRRKKDGVFYTPRYITKYIVENTVGTLCTQKKEELKIVDAEFTPEKRKANKKLLLAKLDEYRGWLLQLSICDPACGSGAFLNQALEFLITEHRYIDELRAKLFGDTLVLTDLENEILENNLYGVDINEEAVEIARLSLWLRTAKKGRKLSSLNSNIKCGNSLIDDPAVAGNKAFNWQEHFPTIFAKDGFDVVIGNPPYVDIKALDSELVSYIFKEYSSANNRINLFAAFIEKSVNILSKGGSFSFIIPSSLLTQESYKELRKYLLEKTQIQSIVRLPNESFGGGAGEVKVDTIVLTFTLNENKDSEIEVIVYKGFDRIAEISSLTANIHSFIAQRIWEADESSIFRINVDDNSSELLLKISLNNNKLVDCAEFCLGLTPYDKYRGHTKEQIENQVFHSNNKKDETFKKLLAGNDIMRYNVDWNGEQWISYGSWLGASREPRFFTEKRILIKQIIDWSSKRIWAALTEEELYNTQNAFNLIPKQGYLPEYLIALLNSKLITFYHKKKFLEEFKDRFQKILIKDCKEFPIKGIETNYQKIFVEKVHIMLSNKKELQQLKRNLLQLLQSKYESIKPSNKLTDWPALSFADFLKELSKQKIKLSLPEQSEWMQYFEQEKAKANALQQTITQTDKEIDAMVYALYELTEDEIKIVEES